MKNHLAENLLHLKKHNQKKKKNHAGCFFACYLLRSGTLSRQETETAISDQTGFYSNPPVSRTIWKLIWRRKQSQTAKQLSVITV